MSKYTSVYILQQTALIQNYLFNFRASLPEALNSLEHLVHRGSLIKSIIVRSGRDTVHGVVVVVVSVYTCLDPEACRYRWSSSPLI